MRLATLKDGTRDGALAVVSPDGKRVLRPADGPGTMQGALDDWPAAIATLRDAAMALAAEAHAGQSADPTRFDSPLPRAYQWAEASSYHSHMERLRAARGVELPPDHGAEPAAGSIIGNGTVSNRDPEAGFGAIEEKRAVELAETGAAKTRYLLPGDRIKIEAFDGAGRSLFGAMDQEVVAA